MTDYTKTVNFAAKDSLSTGNSNKVVRGSEIDTEFNNIATAVATKLNASGAVFTNAVSFPDGTATSPAITNTGDTNTGLFFSAADTIAYTAGGTAQVTFADGLIAPVTTNDVDLGTGSLQFKNAFFDGTVEADAFTVNGVSLSETIADTVGAMVSNNTETNISVTYDDSDNTLDFVVGTVAASNEVTVTANNTADETVYLTFVDGATGSQGIETDTGLSYNPSSGLATLTGFGGTGAIKVPIGSTGQRPSNAAGLLRYNNTTGKFEGYTDAWGDIGGGEATITISTMTGDGSDTTLTLSAAPPSENALQVYFDGVYQHKDTFSFSGTTLTFSTAPASGVKVEAINLLTVAASTTPADTSVTTAKLASNAVTTVKITDANVTTAKIADDAVTAAKLASNAVVTASIVDDNVTQAKIADDAVGADQLAASAVVTASMVDDAVTTAKIADDAITSALIADDAIVAAAIADNAVDIARLNVSDGSAGQSLTTNGSGTLSFATVGGLYNDWLVKTANFTMASGDQIVGNHASTAFTLTLPSSPSAGAVVTVKNVGTATITIGRNSQKINSLTEDGELVTGASGTLVYVNSTIGWSVI